MQPVFNILPASRRQGRLAIGRKAKLCPPVVQTGWVACLIPEYVPKILHLVTLSYCPSQWPSPDAAAIGALLHGLYHGSSSISLVAGLQDVIQVQVTDLCVDLLQQPLALLAWIQ